MLYELQPIRKAVILLSQVLSKRGEYIMWRQSFPSGEIFEVIVIPLPTTPLEGILSMTTVVTLSSCTATSSSGQAIISLFMGM